MSTPFNAATGIFGTAIEGIVAIKSLELIGNMLKDIPKEHRPNYEVTTVRSDNSTGKTLGYVKAKSRDEAVHKLNQHRNLPEKVRAFPVKVTSKKSNVLFDYDHYFNYNFVGLK